MNENNTPMNPVSAPLPTLITLTAEQRWPRPPVSPLLCRWPLKGGTDPFSIEKIFSDFANCYVLFLKQIIFPVKDSVTYTPLDWMVNIHVATVELNQICRYNNLVLLWVFFLALPRCCVFISPPRPLSLCSGSKITFEKNFHYKFCFPPLFGNHKTDTSARTPFWGACFYKAMANQRKKISDNNPITYPPVILSCLNSTIIGELCACETDRHKITGRGVCFLPSQCAACLPLREKGLMLAWYCIRHPQ